MASQLANSADSLWGKVAYLLLAYQQAGYLVAEFQVVFRSGPPSAVVFAQNVRPL
jgi:hypothetical protein